MGRHFTCFWRLGRSQLLTVVFSCFRKRLFHAYSSQAVLAEIIPALRVEQPGYLQWLADARNGSRVALWFDEWNAVVLGEWFEYTNSIYTYTVFIRIHILLFPTVVSCVTIVAVMIFVLIVLVYTYIYI